MKSYKEFSKRFIGCSDGATLTLIGGDKDNTRTEELYFGEDNNYMAYLVKGDDVEIGSHYKLVHTFEHHLEIHDDEELTADFDADIIKVYRAGEMGCIIQLISYRRV